MHLIASLYITEIMISYQIIYILLCDIESDCMVKYTIMKSKVYDY